MSACIETEIEPTAEIIPFQDVSERSRAGRIESYIHSDTVTPNKGGSLVKVTCDTDFAARTDEFCLFARTVAKFAYAASATSWTEIAASYPELHDQLVALRTTLGERIEVSEVVVMKV